MHRRDLHHPDDDSLITYKVKGSVVVYFAYEVNDFSACIGRNLDFCNGFVCSFDSHLCADAACFGLLPPLIGEFVFVGIDCLLGAQAQFLACFDLQHKRS